MITILGQSERFNIPWRSFGDYVTSSKLSKVHIGQKPDFTAEQETQLVAWIMHLADSGFSLRQNFLQKVFTKICVENHIRH